MAGPTKVEKGLLDPTFKTTELAGKADVGLGNVPDSAFHGRAKLTVLGTANGTGNWVLNNVVVDVPIFIFFRSVDDQNGTAYINMWNSSGIAEESRSTTMLFGVTAGYGRDVFGIIWPKSTTVTLNVSTMSGTGVKLTATQ